MYVFILQQENDTQNMSVERLTYTTNFWKWFKIYEKFMTPQLWLQKWLETKFNDVDGKVFLGQKWQKSRSPRTKMQKIVYCAYLRENGSIYNTEIIFGRFYTYCKRHFPTQNTNFWYVCLKNVFAYCTAQKRCAIFPSVMTYHDAIHIILLHECQKWRLSVKFFR